MNSELGFLSVLNEAVWCFDIDRQEFIYVNDTLAAIFGVTLAELRDSPFLWRKLVHPDDYYYVSQQTERVYQGESIALKYRILVAGRVRWIADKKYPVLSDAGKVKGMAGMVYDITDRMNMQKDLAESEGVYRSLFEDNPIPQWIYDMDTLEFLAVNHAATEKYGYTEQEFLSMTIADIRPQDDVRRLISSVREIRGRQSRSEGWTHLRKDGSLLNVNVSGFSIKYKGRRAEIVTIQDISSEVRSRKEVAISRKNAEALINNIEDLIWSVDRNCCLISANASFHSAVKRLYSASFRPGESVVHADNEAIGKWKEYYQRVLSGHSVVFISVPSNAPGETFEVRMKPIYNEHEIVGVACVSRNIQKKLEAEKRMVLQNIELKEIVSLASHEIRGPVTSLMGLMNLLNKTNLADPFNKEVISHIDLAIKELDSVIHKIVNKSYAIQRENEAIYSSPQNLSDYE
ncbi:PAS domain S-box protein [Arcticibacter sp. MXS-1]|uniref:PAS domain-containing protein n=1 Tax=Arcticibacter sp. MXS-1 TaxID=3341726 RepID=UPI0035A82393